MRKYSEKFIHEYAKLSKGVIGFEFEFFVKNLSFYKTLEMLNKELDPVKVHGFRQYHSDFRVDSKNFKLEPDLSGGSNMCELITGPLPYNDAKYYLIKILKFIQDVGYTNDKSSVHFNLSFNDVDKNLNDLNILKLILNTDEDEIYRYYPSRKDNIYAKSVKKIIPYKEFDFFNIPIDSVKNMVRLPNDKYYGINFTNITNPKETQRIEYRYIGGKDYEKNIGNIVYFLDRFILDSYNSVDASFNISDSRKLEDYLDKNISKLKSFSKYENFLIEYPNITVQVDQNSMFEMVNSYFARFYKKIWDFLDSCEEIDECIINYVTKSQTLEVVDANMKLIGTIKNIDLISCSIGGGILENCQIYSSEILNSHISKSKIDNSEVKNSKVILTRVETTKLDNCYFEGGVLNSEMIGGVWRSGELGPFSSISPETKIVDDYTNFFDTKFDSELDKDSKGVMKIYKK
jgi:hypothetical protein